MLDKLDRCSVISHSTLVVHLFQYRTGACMFGYTKIIHLVFLCRLIQTSVVNREHVSFINKKNTINAGLSLPHDAGQVVTQANQFILSVTKVRQTLEFVWPSCP